MQLILIVCSPTNPSVITIPFLMLGFVSSYHTKVLSNVLLTCIVKLLKCLVECLTCIDTASFRADFSKIPFVKSANSMGIIWVVIYMEVTEKKVC